MRSKERFVQNEDCLNLNIWTPNRVLGTDEKLPVLVYIHGEILQLGHKSFTLTLVVEVGRSRSKLRDKLQN